MARRRITMFFHQTEKLVVYKNDHQSQSPFSNTIHRDHDEKLIARINRNWVFLFVPSSNITKGLPKEKWYAKFLVCWLSPCMSIVEVQNFICLAFFQLNIFRNNTNTMKQQFDKSQPLKPIEMMKLQRHHLVKLKYCFCSLKLNESDM